MYEVITDSLVDSVGIETLSPSDLAAYSKARRSLRSDSQPSSYGCRPEGDAWQIQIACDRRRMLLGYDIYEKRKLIFLSYLRWDEDHEEIEKVGWFRKWVLPFLDHKP